MSLSSNERVRLNIKYYRILNGFTQKQISEHLNIDEKHYCSLEGGKYHFTLPNIDIICNILKIEPWILFKERHTQEEIENL